MSAISQLPHEFQGPGSHEERKGIALMCAAMVLLPIGDAISKHLTGYASPVEVSTWRTLVQAALFIPIALMFRRHIQGGIFSMHSLVSGALLATVFVCLISAFEVMPIATAIAIFFLEPLALTVLSGPLLGEKVGVRRYAAVGVGLIGALVIIRPNFIEFGPTVLLPVIAAVAYALNMIVMRRATQHRSALAFQLGATWYAAGILGIATFAPGLLGWSELKLASAPREVWLYVLAVGAVSVATYILIASAFSRVEASALAPYQYLEIVGATVVGFIFFSDVPDAMTCLGTAIILGSGAYIFHRERVRGAQVATSPVRAPVDAES